MQEPRLIKITPFICTSAYLEPISCVSSCPAFSEGAPRGERVGLLCDKLIAGLYFILSSLRAYHQGRHNTMVDDCNIRCLLIRQEIFFIYILYVFFKEIMFSKEVKNILNCHWHCKKPGSTISQISQF